MIRGVVTFLRVRGPIFLNHFGPSLPKKGESPNILSLLFSPFGDYGPAVSVEVPEPCVSFLAELLRSTVLHHQGKL